MLYHGFSPIARCQYAGLINSYLSDDSEGFDSIIIGSSLSENFRPEYIPEKTSLKRTLKIAIGYSTPVEQNILVQRAIDKGNIHHIYWEIFPYLYHMPENYNFSNIATLERFPAYLYNNEKIDDYRYIFNLSTLVSSIDIIQGEKYFIDTIEKIGYWENLCGSQNICDQFYSAEAIEKIINEYTPKKISIEEKKLNQSEVYKNFDEFVLKKINNYCNSQISIDLFFPPVSMLWFSNLTDKDFYYEFYLLRHAVTKTSSCRNVRVFAFNNELWITGDLSNYHDPKHFYGSIHDFIIDAMAQNRNRVTLENIDDFENQMIININEYQPYGTKLYPH